LKSTQKGGHFDTQHDPFWGKQISPPIKTSISWSENVSDGVQCAKRHFFAQVTFWNIILGISTVHSSSSFFFISYQICVKRRIFRYLTQPYSVNKISSPYYVKPNLTLPEKSCLSAWILNIEFLKNYFCDSQAHCKQDQPRLFW
jgi:hypothetical protein